MKLKHFLTLATLVIGGGSLWAQTDVTSDYITNADFEGASGVFLQLNTARLIYKPIGWSVQWDQSSKGQNGNSVIDESWNQDSYVWNAKEGKSFFVRHAWEGNTLYLRQTMVGLRPGKYSLSFAMAANRANDNNTIKLSVAGETKDISPATNGNPSGTWDNVSIDFTITSSTPNATIEIKAEHTGNSSSNAYLKYGLDNFKLTYDGSDYYSIILSNAQSLYVNNVDWADGAEDLNVAITEATGKSTIDEKNAAIFALEDAMKTFKDNNSQDVTSLITNANFDSNISGWTTTGGDGNAFQRQTSTQTNFSDGFLEKWRDANIGRNNQKNFDVYQTLTDLPNGEYTIKAAILATMQGQKGVFDSNTSGYVGRQHGGPYYIDDNKGVWMYGTSGETTAKAWANTDNGTFVGNGGGVYRTVTVSVSNGNLTIGFKGIGSPNGGSELGTYANWIACDNWTLSYFGFDPSTLKAQISGLKDDVQAIIDGDEVSNAVKSSLQNTLDNLVETPETKSVLDAAVSTLEGAIEAANATKAPYAKVKALITLATNEKDNSTGTKADIETAITVANSNIETRTTATDLTSDYTTLETAREAYITGGAQPTPGNVFDFTFKINDAAVTGTGWSAAGTANGQQYTNAPDDRYFDCGWNSTLNKNQTVESLPAGSYTLKAATRAMTSEVTTANIYVNQSNSALNKSTNNHADGSTGGELGNGWGWSEVDFVVLEAGDVTVGFYGQTTGHGWAGADDFHLYYNGTAPMYKEALFDAIASANTLYNNGANIGTGVFQIPEAAGTAFSEAIDDANDVYDDDDASASEIKDAISALQTAITAFNSAELNAPADGARYYLKVATSGHAKEGNAIVVSLGATSANNPTGYGFAANASPAAHIAGAYIFTKVEGKSNTYNICIERPEGTVYLTYGSLNGSAAGWKTQQIQGTTNAENKGEFKIVATSTANVFNIVNTVFEGADNYIDCQDNGALYTDTNIDKKDFSLAEASQASVAVSVAAGKLATRIFPFKPTLPEGVEAYSCAANTGSSLTFTKVDEPEANVPYILYSENGCSSTDLTGWGTAAADTYTEGYLTGVFARTEVPQGSYVLQTQNETQAFYKVDQTGAYSSAYRVYVTVPSSSVKSFAFTLDDVETAINEARQAEELKNVTIFNLAGQRISAPQKGVNIINGKKVLVK